MTPHQDIESKIIAFLDGEMDLEEAEALLQEIERNDEYKLLLADFQKSYITQIQEEEEIFFHKKNQLLKPASVQYFVRIGSIAAALVLIVSYFVFQSEKKQSITTPQSQNMLVQRQDLDRQESPPHTPSKTDASTPPKSQTNAPILTQSLPTKTLQNNIEDDRDNRLLPFDKLQPVLVTPQLEYQQEINLAFVGIERSPVSLEKQAPRVEKIGTIAIQPLLPEFQEIKESIQHYGDKVFEQLTALNDKYKSFSN